MLSTYNDGLTPPLNSVLVPGKASAKAIKKAWQTEYRNRRINTLKQQSTYIGHRRLGMIRWAFKHNKLPDMHRIRTDKVFHVGFDNVPEWIAAPQAFDFPERKLLPFQKHLNTLVDLERVEDLAPAYQTAVERIELDRQTNSRIKLIYVSLGTAQEADKRAQRSGFSIN